MVVVGEVAGAVVVPACCGIDETSWVEFTYEIGQAELRVVGVGDLSPSFIVDDLETCQLGPGTCLISDIPRQ